MRAAQRGAGLLIGVLLLVTVAAFGAIVAASQSAGDIQGTDAQADSVQALYLAETGLERALKNFAVGTACGAALSQVITDLSTIGLGTADYTITIGAGLTTDFSGATLPATRCRIPVTATVNASNVSRTLHAIVDRNLLEGPDNPTFDNPSIVGAPSGWTLTTSPPLAAPAGFATGGGPNGTTPPSCSRSAWLLKNQTANVQATASGSVPVAFTIQGASVTTVSFYYRVNNRDNGGPCPAGAASGPGFPCSVLGVNDALLCFRLVAGAAPVDNDSTRLATDFTANVTQGCPDPDTPTSILVTTFASCQAGYPGYPAKATLTITDGGLPAATRTMNQFLYFALLRNAGRKEFYLDHIEATNNTAVGAARVQVWRDCSSRTDPATCT
jgi:hypothetical protein